MNGLSQMNGAHKPNVLLTHAVDFRMPPCLCKRVYRLVKAFEDHHARERDGPVQAKGRRVMAGSVCHLKCEGHARKCGAGRRLATNVQSLAPTQNGGRQRASAMHACRDGMVNHKGTGQ